jgi:hypothetical protein
VKLCKTSSRLISEHQIGMIELFIMFTLRPVASSKRCSNSTTMSTSSLARRMDNTVLSAYRDSLRSHRWNKLCVLGFGSSSWSGDERGVEGRASGVM